MELSEELSRNLEWLLECARKEDPRTFGDLNLEDLVALCVWTSIPCPETPEVERALKKANWGGSWGHTPAIVRTHLTRLFMVNRRRDGKGTHHGHVL